MKRSETGSESRPSLLFLSQTLPYPPDSGVTKRSLHILEELTKGFDVTLVAFSRKQHQPDEAKRREAEVALGDRSIDVEEAALIGSEWSKARLIWDHLRSVGTRRPCIYYTYASDVFTKQLRASLARRAPDIIHVDSLDLYRWLPGLPPAPIACTHHNIESSLLALRAKHTKPALLGAYVRWQAHLLEELERRVSPSFVTNIMMSDLDAQRLTTLAPSASTVVVPNGVDTEFFAPVPDTTPVPGRIVFLGPSYILANRDGVEFFLEEMWARIRAARPDATLHLIGSSPPQHRERFEKTPGVTCLGQVPDIRPHLAQAACSIVPLRVGGGTRLKVLDAWAMGRAVVSTTVGCEGLHTVDAENIIVRDDPTSFADAVINLLDDPELRLHIEENARNTAEKRYSWAVIGADLRRLYRQITSG
jgi:glycosyltransferase involved in cell wall biosynthesis